jgi:2-iminobutanoate/2-iminopropanoate deaminase
MVKPLVTTLEFPWQQGLPIAQSVRNGEIVFTSGQAGFDENGELVGDDFESQCRQAFENLDTVLRGQGASLDSMLRLSAFFAEADQYAEFKRIRPDFLSAPYPASTAVVVGFVFPGMQVELEAVAVRGGTRTRDDG